MSENYTNRGEYRTYKMLRQLDKRFPEDKFHIFANLYIDSDDNRFPNRQVDHLVVCRKGIFMIETKYWTGAVYHNIKLADLLRMIGVGKDGSMDGLYLVKRLLPREVMQQGTESFTMCIKNPDNIQVYAGDENPINQVVLSGLSLNRLIQNKLNQLGIKPYIHEFVFYNYVSEDPDNKVIDLHNVLDQPYDDDFNKWGEGFSKPALFRSFYSEVHEKLPDWLGLTDDQVNAIARLIHETVVLD